MPRVHVRACACACECVRVSVCVVSMCVSVSVSVSEYVCVSECICERVCVWERARACVWCAHVRGVDVFECLDIVIPCNQFRIYWLFYYYFLLLNLSIWTHLLWSPEKTHIDSLRWPHLVAIISGFGAIFIHFLMAFSAYFSECNRIFAENLRWRHLEAIINGFDPFLPIL